MLVLEIAGGILLAYVALTLFWLAVAAVIKNAETIGVFLGILLLIAIGGFAGYWALFYLVKVIGSTPILWVMVGAPIVLPPLVRRFWHRAPDELPHHRAHHVDRREPHGLSR